MLHQNKFQMKKHTLLFLILTFLLMGCRKTELYIAPSHITVFTLSSEKKFIVVIDDVEQTGYATYTGVIPNCGDAGYRSFELSAGEHKVVTLDSAYFWKSEQHIFVIQNGCTSVEVP